MRSFGTEDRQTDKPVAPRNEVYEYIIFRASDIKDLIVDDPPSASPGLSDPAIIQAVSHDVTERSPRLTRLPRKQQSVGPSSLPTSTYASATTATSVAPLSAPRREPVDVTAASGAQAAGARASRGSTPVNKSASPTQQQDKRRQNQNRNDNQRGGRQQQQVQRGNQHNNAQPRQQQQQYQQQGGQRVQNFQGNARGRQQQRPPFQNRPMNFYQRQPRNNFQRQPRTDVTKLEDYDFEKANLEFTELEKGISSLGVTDKEPAATAENNDANDPNAEPAYDKAKSFFDSISCEAIERSKG